MQLDALGRSLPWETHDDPQEKRDKRFVFTDADFAMFEFIDRHGYMPSHYIRAKVGNLRKNKADNLKRFTRFCKGSEHQGKILVAPAKQFAQAFAHARHKVYALAPYARKLIHDKGTVCPVPSTRSNWFVHDLMQACVAASFELTAPEHGLRYVSRSEVLLHPLSGTSRAQANPMAIPVTDKRAITPDDVFALELDGKKRFFIVEIDRASESMTPFEEPKANTTYFGKKLDDHLALLQNGAFKAWLGVSKPRIIIVTTTVERVRQILTHLHGRPSADSFYLTVVPEFAAKWRVPNHVLTHLLNEEWATVGGMMSII